MKLFHCQSGFVRVETIGAERTEFEAPIFVGSALQTEIAKRRARSRSIREQNRRTQGEI